MLYYQSLSLSTVCLVMVSLLLDSTIAKDAKLSSRY